MKTGKRNQQFEFIQMDSDDPEAGFSDDGTLFSIVFVWSKKLKHTVKGANLETGYDQITFHRMAWIRAADRGLRPDDKEPFIESIKIEVIEESRT